MQFSWSLQASKWANNYVPCFSRIEFIVIPSYCLLKNSLLTPPMLTNPTKVFLQAIIDERVCGKKCENYDKNSSGTKFIEILNDEWRGISN